MALIPLFRTMALGLIAMFAVESQMVQAQTHNETGTMPTALAHSVSYNHAANVKTQASTPAYRPPRRQAPAQNIRVGGATRSSGRQLPVLVALVPEHAGMTDEPSPTLYWYLDAPVAQPIEFVLIHEASGNILIDFHIQHSLNGIHALRLADYNISLNQGELYTWSVALIEDVNRRSRDLIAFGSVIRIPEEIRQQDGQNRTVNDYAEAGLWYNALKAALSPSVQNIDARATQAGLLRQVGLVDVADYVELVPSWRIAE